MVGNGRVGEEYTVFGISYRIRANTPLFGGWWGEGGGGGGGVVSLVSLGKGMLGWGIIVLFFGGVLGERGGGLGREIFSPHYA